MEEHLLTPLNREHASTDLNLDSADDGPSLRTRRKPVLTFRRLLILIAILYVLSIFSGTFYLVFWVARYFWRMAFDPHRSVKSRWDYNAVESYYGKKVSQFDVVASVFVRIGKDLPEDVEDFGMFTDTFEESAFGDWQSLYSQVVFSRISLNSKDKIFKKTIDVPIPLDVLSQFYKRNTFFPQIVNTFVIVPSEPDPILALPDPPRVDMIESKYHHFPAQSPTPTSWKKHRVQQLARPMSPLFDRPYGDSPLENVSSSLNAFYDSGAVREFALRPVLEVKHRQFFSSFDIEDDEFRNEMRFMPLHRNTSLKIKSRSWLSMAKETPKYTFSIYDRERRTAGDKQLEYEEDSLNWRAMFTHAPFKTIGHYRSHIVQTVDLKKGHRLPNMTWIPLERKSYFYGPYLTLRDHAAGSEDWITLPRVDEFSDIQSDSFIIPCWLDRLRAYEDYWDPSYREAITLQTMDFINAMFRNSHTSSRRPVLRSVFFLIGGFIQYPLGFILQTYYLFSRCLSTGLSLPSMILYLSFKVLYGPFFYSSGRYGYRTSALEAVAIHVISIVSICRWACLWWGIGFKWNGWSGSVPVEIKRFGRTHSERTSMRADQKFTWIQRGLFVIILTIVFVHLPHLTSPTHPRGSPSFLFLYGASLSTSLSMMAASSQILLNWRLGTFAGSIPAFAWTQVVGTALVWTPTIFHSVFGKFHTTDPVKIDVVLRLIIDSVLLWQAVSLPTVSQEENDDE